VTRASGKSIMGELAQRLGITYNAIKPFERTSAREDNAMDAALAVGFMLAIWVVVIWGAMYFNRNVH
jgi:hypothetical protein